VHQKITPKVHCRPTNTKLELDAVWDRDIDLLSGGELQRFAIGMVCVQKADVYMFDEPSSFLDVKQRLAAGRLIRSLLGPDSYVIVVEHDLSILDYLSDYICVLYGKPAVYGVVTAPFSVREGINIFLDGNVPTENLRFRDESLQFRIGDASDEYFLDKSQDYSYPAMEKTMGNFHLKIDPGTFTGSEIVVMMGENGTGKTTFCKMLAGALKPDNDQKIPAMNISMKPQKITPKFQGTVRQLFFKRIKAAFINPQFQTDVYKPLKMDDFIDQEVQNLSGGELQRVAIVLALGMPADIYVIDEPSAYLDSEQRIVASRVIKRFIMHAKKTAFVVEHDFIMATYLADRVIVFDGEPSIKTHANTPESLLTGCNTFLKALDVTFRRDPSTYRPRINKLNSVKDAEQKAAGSYVSQQSSPLTVVGVHANKTFTVLPGGRGLKGVAEDYNRDAAAGRKLSVQSSHRAGTKRRRVIKSGADELLDLKRAEDDKDDEGDLADITHHPPPSRLQALERTSRGFSDGVSFPRRIARQWASTPESKSRFSVLLYACATTRLLLAFVYPRMAHACYEVMGNDNDNITKSVMDLRRPVALLPVQDFPKGKKWKKLHLLLTRGFRYSHRAVYCDSA
jgi:ATP-binding cassette, sub-family E, member 1